MAALLADHQVLVALLTLAGVVMNSITSTGWIRAHFGWKGAIVEKVAAQYVAANIHALDDGRASAAGVAMQAVVAPDTPDLTPADVMKAHAAVKAIRAPYTPRTSPSTKGS